jgi:hypothetical protein
MQLWPIALEREQIVAAALDDGCGDVDLGADGVDGDESALELETLQQKGDRPDLVRLLRRRFLPQDQALAARSGRHHVQRADPLRAGMGPP